MHCRHCNNTCCVCIATTRVMCALHQLMHCRHCTNSCIADIAATRALQALHQLVHCRHCTNSCIACVAPTHALQVLHLLVHCRHCTNSCIADIALYITMHYIICIKYSQLKYCALRYSGNEEHSILWELQRNEPMLICLWATRLQYLHCTSNAVFVLYFILDGNINRIETTS